jgi:hypothetical protein
VSGTPGAETTGGGSPKTTSTTSAGEREKNGTATTTTRRPESSDTPSTAAAPRVEPYVLCVEQVAYTRWKAHFGYRNSGPEVRIERGPRNEVMPGDVEQDRPERFLPEGKRDAFAATFSSASVTWLLDGRMAIATRYSQRC